MTFPHRIQDCTAHLNVSDLNCYQSSVCSITEITSGDPNSAKSCTEKAFLLVTAVIRKREAKFCLRSVKGCLIQHSVRSILSEISDTDSDSSAWSPVKCHFAQPSRAADLSCRATISVTNTSSIQGADVVQIYVSHLTASIRRPERELKGFAKTTIQSGETKDAIIELDKWAFAFYDEGQQCWKAEKGKYIVRACKSSRIEDQMSEFVIELAETWTWVGL